MYTVVVTIHIIVCIVLVLTVLLQQGKGAEVGAVFGSSEAMFGSAGPASALNKVTTVVAIIFMITSLALTYLAAHRKGNSIMEGVKVEAPVAPSAEKKAVPVTTPVTKDQTGEVDATHQQPITSAAPGQTPVGQTGETTNTKQSEHDAAAATNSSGTAAADKATPSK